MNKYIKPLLINESLNKGSVILIKGKKNKDGKRNLYATYIDGYSEIKKGLIMLFLSNDFYIIKKENDRLKAYKIDYKDEDLLKDALNFKSSGKLSIVQNHNKTPYYWKTLKHKLIKDAIEELEDELLNSDEYLFEFKINENNESNSNLEKFYNIILKKFIKKVFFNKDEDLDILNYKVIIDSEEIDRDLVFWEADFKILYFSSDLDKEFNEFDLPKSLEIVLYLKSDIEYDEERDRYSFIYTNIEEIYLDGSSYKKDPELSNLIDELDKILRNFSKNDLKNFLDKNIEKPFYLK